MSAEFSADVRQLIERSPFFEFLPADILPAVLEALQPVEYRFGQVLAREGEAGDSFQLLVSGRARVVKTDKAGEEIPLDVLRPGDCIGETALLTEQPHRVTVRASADVRTLRLDALRFQQLLHEHPTLQGFLELQSHLRTLWQFLRANSVFGRLPTPALRVMLEELQPRSVRRGELVVRAGDPPGPMYIVEQGRLRVFIEQPDGRRDYRTYLRSGDYFGELSLLRNSPRTASVEAVEDGRLLLLHPETVEKLQEQFPEFKGQLEERIAQYDYKQTARVPLDFAEEPLPMGLEEKASPDQASVINTAASDNAPFATSDGRFVKAQRRIGKIPWVQSMDDMGCGPACLAMVCRFYGRAVSVSRIQQLSGTDLDGTSLRGLCRAAEALGLAARPVRATVAHIEAMPLPAILHWRGNHWVVLTAIDAERAWIIDPGLGPMRVPREKFDAEWSGYAALFDYTAAFADAPVEKPSFGWVWKFARPYAGTLAKAVGLAFLASGLQLLLPVFSQVIVDHVIIERDAELLNSVVAGLGVVVVLMVLALVLQRYLLSFVAVRVDAASLDFITRKLLALPLRYFQTRRTPDIQRRINGVRNVRSFLVQEGLRGLTSAAQLSCAISLMFVYSVKLAGVYLGTAPLYLLLMWYAGQRLKSAYQDLEEGLAKYETQHTDAIKGIETVKTAGVEHSFRESLLARFHKLSRVQFQADFTMMSYEGVIEAVSCLSLGLFLWFGAREVMAGGLTIGAFVAFSALVSMANAPLVSLLNLWDNLQHTHVLLNRLQDVFDPEPEQGSDRSKLRPVPSLEGQIQFRNVTLQFAGAESPRILDGMSFEIPAGTRVGIVGRSGGGKTTLFKALVGMYEPTEGSILIDGVDIRTLNYRELRRRIGFVLQENYLFDGTLAENIALGAEQPDLDRVAWAARMAHAHTFIERLPLGYETKTGEYGLALSGGQKQRVAIARALYHDPPVLLFDEATSAMDTESERAVQENMQAILSNRTSLVIAHRMSTVRDCDLLLVVDRGKIVEQGTHDELMQARGLYFYLCSQQLGA